MNNNKNNNNNKSLAESGTVAPSLKPSNQGTVALAIASNRDQNTLTKAGLTLVSALPDSKFTQTVGTVQAVSRAAQAAQQGSALGVGMALAGAVPGSDFSEAMGKIGAVSNALSAAKQGSIVGAGMALAGIDPNSDFAKVMGQVAQAKDIFNQGMALLKPNIDPNDLILNLNETEITETPPIETQSGGVNLSGKSGAFVKGESLKCAACALANQEAKIGAPVQALYGSKVLSGGDDIDYTGQGYLPFTMSRIYNSQNPDTGWFGQGWVTQGYEQRLELDPQHNRIYLIDNTGRRVPFTYLAPGQSCYQPCEGITLYRKPLVEDKKQTIASGRPIIVSATSGTRIGDDEPLEFTLYRGQYQPTVDKSGSTETSTVADNFEGLAQHYSHVASLNKRGTKAVVLLSSYADKYGHTIQLHYTHASQSGAAHIPQYLTDSGGGCYEFELTRISEQVRLSTLYLMDSSRTEDNRDRTKRTALVSYNYNEDGDLIEVKQKERITRSFAYQNHIMVAQGQTSGQQAVYRYDQYDNAKTARVIEHGINNGKYYLLDYDIDSDGVKSTTVIEQPDSELERSRRFEYDDWYNMTSSTNYLGNTTHFDIDDNNRTIQITRPDGSDIRYNYQGSHLNSVQIQTDISETTKLPTYREISYQYNRAGKVIAVTDAVGNSQRFTYNARGELKSQTDALGHTTTFSYDEDGNILGQTLANGSQFSFEYDDHGNLITQTDCSGYQTHYAYDDQQRMRRITDAMGHVTEYHHKNTKAHLQHLLSQVSYPDGTTVQMGYDDQGRLIEYTDAIGQSVHYDYDANGQPTRREETTNNSNTSTSNSPTSNIRPDSDKLDKDNVATVKRLNEAGQALAYRYDVLGRLTTLINENGETWAFEYDANDRLINESRFDGHQSQYQYSVLGQIIHQIDNANLDTSQQRHTYLCYNRAGQVTERYSSHYPEIISQSNTQAHKSSQPEHSRVRYHYDNVGRLITATNLDSRIDFGYDAAGRLINESLTSHLTGQYKAREHTLTHEYDEIGNRTKTTLPDGKTINQLYYGSGHLYNQSLYNPQTDNLIELRHSEHNKVHQEISRHQGALESSYGYDPMGRLTEQQSKADQSITVERHYHYDTLGHLTHLTGRSQLGSKKAEVYTRGHQYDYDNQGRLTQHKLTDYQNHTGITEVFAFDPASNRVPVAIQQSDDSEDNNKGAVNNYGRPTELMTNGNSIRYTYDSHGRMMYKTKESVDNSKDSPRSALHLQYNANNEVASSIIREYQGEYIKQTCTRYHYDSFGRRIAKHSEIRQLVVGQNDKTQSQFKQNSKTQYQHTHFLWDGDKPIQEYSDTHVYTTIYGQDSFKPVARLMWLRDDMPEPINDEPIITKDNPHIKVKVEPKSKIRVYYYHNDQLGTPNELTNDKGEVVWLADYEAWGNTAKVIYSETKLEKLKVAKEHLQPIRFQGQHFDEETGLHYNRFRYYDPDMGMFISRDPIGLRGGDNIFQYAPNPTGWVDPLGLFDYPSRSDAIANLGITPAIPGHTNYRTGITGSAQYSKAQERAITREWDRIVQNDIQQHLAAGRMASCPSSPPTNTCTSCEAGATKWRIYGSNNPKLSIAFHCGFDGYLENRIPTTANPAPTNECFYENGVLVTAEHKYGGCRGTPDYFPYFNGLNDADKARKDDHANIDPGGTNGPSLSHGSLQVEGALTSGKYFKDQAIEGVPDLPSPNSVYQYLDREIKSLYNFPYW